MAGCRNVVNGALLARFGDAALESITTRKAFDAAVSALAMADHVVELE